MQGDRASRKPVAGLPLKIFIMMLQGWETEIAWEPRKGKVFGTEEQIPARLLIKTPGVGGSVWVYSTATASGSSSAQPFPWSREPGPRPREMKERTAQSVP